MSGTKYELAPGIPLPDEKIHLFRAAQKALGLLQRDYVLIVRPGIRWATLQKRARGGLHKKRLIGATIVELLQGCCTMRSLPRGAQALRLLPEYQTVPLLPEIAAWADDYAQPRRPGG